MSWLLGRIRLACAILCHCIVLTFQPFFFVICNALEFREQIWKTASKLILVCFFSFRNKPLALFRYLEPFLMKAQKHEVFIFESLDLQWFISRSYLDTRFMGKRRSWTHRLGKVCYLQKYNGSVRFCEKSLYRQWLKALNLPWVTLSTCLAVTW